MGRLTRSRLPTVVAALMSRRTWPMTRETGHCHCVEEVVGVDGGHVWSGLVQQPPSSLFGSMYGLLKI